MSDKFINDPSYKSYIKDVYLELPAYKFEHLSYKKDSDKFVPRKGLEEKFINFLKSGKSGAYLVTGFRGMGKTSFVKKVLSDLKDYYIEENKFDMHTKVKLETINISFNQKSTSEIEILKQVITGLLTSIDGPSLRASKFLFHPRTFVFIFSIVFFSVFIKFFLCDWFRNLPNNGQHLLDLLWVMGVISLITTFVLSIPFIMIRNYQQRINIHYSLVELYEKCNSEKTEEFGMQEFKENFFSGFFSKKVRKYNIANSKEVENEIIRLISKINELPEKIQLIIVFDEIDKLEVSENSASYYSTLSDSREKETSGNENRRRKQAAINVLANLKYLITTAEAKFIFIAGREMFDAALADIADRQSAISSIFHQIINVDSFLKEKLENDGAIGLTSTIEEYLKLILIPRGERKDNEPFLKQYYNSLCDQLHEDAKLKIIFCLQNLIVYLTYRGNGSPKKMIRILEDFIVNGKFLESFGTRYSEDNTRIVIQKTEKFPKAHSLRFFLRIDYFNQYRFSIVSFLYRPLLSSQGIYKVLFR
jgi:Cdc6-like AAA superfamily ATPase